MKKLNKSVINSESRLLGVGASRIVYEINIGDRKFAIKIGYRRMLLDGTIPDFMLSSILSKYNLRKNQKGLEELMRLTQDFSKKENYMSQNKKEYEHHYTLSQSGRYKDYFASIEHSLTDLSNDILVMDYVEPICKKRLGELELIELKVIYYKEIKTIRDCVDSMVDEDTIVSLAKSFGFDFYKVNRLLLDFFPFVKFIKKKLPKSNIHQELHELNLGYNGRNIVLIDYGY